MPVRFLETLTWLLNNAAKQPISKWTQIVIGTRAGTLPSIALSESAMRKVIRARQADTPVKAAALEFLNELFKCEQNPRTIPARRS